MNSVKKYGILGFIIRGIGTFLYRIFILFYNKMVLDKISIDEKQIMFLSYPDFSDNSRILYEYMQKEDLFKNYKFVWLYDETKNCDDKLFSNTVFIKWRSRYYSGISPKALLKIMSSKYIFYTHISPTSEIEKNEQQLVINLWHGCGYKKRTTKLSSSDNNLFDYALVPGDVFVPIKAEFWACNEDKVIPIGYPRYDLLFDKSQDSYRYITNIKRNNSKIIFWMPTFRKTSAGRFTEENITGYYELPIISDFEQLIELNKFCEKHKLTICIKRHPSQIKYKCEDYKFSNIIFISNKELEENNIQLYSLFQYSDGLISDYSSVAIDYLLLDKPLGFTLNDYEDYKNAKGFVFDNPLKYMPGQHIISYDDLKKFIFDIIKNIDIYQEERKEILKETHNICDSYCKRICDFCGLSD